MQCADISWFIRETRGGDYKLSKQFCLGVPDKNAGAPPPRIPTLWGSGLSRVGQVVTLTVLASLTNSCILFGDQLVTCSGTITAKGLGYWHMRPEKRLYLWSEIEDIPDETGVYAWYYRHTLSDFDIKKLISDLEPLGAIASEQTAARACVRDFLQKHLFRAFIEEPYEALIQGNLKPTYRGSLGNVAAISKDLIERIVAEPTRLWTLKTVMEEAVPEFAAPVYIGMTTSLKRRLLAHKSLIETYMAAAGRTCSDQPPISPDRNDHSFAREVVRRGFSINGLAVAVRVIDAAEAVHVDAENILNRINYPLCGRS